MYQCCFLSCDKCAMVMEDFNDMGSWVRDLWKVSVPCKSKITPHEKFIKK